MTASSWRRTPRGAARGWIRGRDSESVADDAMSSAVTPTLHPALAPPRTRDFTPQSRVRAKFASPSRVRDVGLGIALGLLAFCTLVHFTALADVGDVGHDVHVGVADAEEFVEREVAAIGAAAGLTRPRRPRRRSARRGARGGGRTCGADGGVGAVPGVADARGVPPVPQAQSRVAVLRPRRLHAAAQHAEPAARRADGRGADGGGEAAQTGAVRRVRPRLRRDEPAVGRPPAVGARGVGWYRGGGGAADGD